MNGELDVTDEAEAFLFANHVCKDFEQAVNGALARFLDEVTRYAPAAVPDAAHVLAKTFRDAATDLEWHYPLT